MEKKKKRIHHRHQLCKQLIKVYTGTPISSSKMLQVASVYVARCSGNIIFFNSPGS